MTHATPQDAPADALTPEVRSFSKLLQSCPLLDRDAYAQACASRFAPGRELVTGQADYVRVHQDRFFELFNAVALLTDGLAAPRLLEFGVSEFSGLYRPLFPQARLDLSDRPAAENFPGFTETVARRVSGCNGYFAVDLEAPGALRRPGGVPQAAYDVVLFAEVLEHLVVNPVELLADLLALLAPTGTLYLTTPNFFSWKNRSLMDRWENPQAVFPQAGSNWDAHHHHREYGAREMLRFIDQAGGALTGFYLSDCWDRGRTARRQVIARPEERSMLVFTVRRAPDTA